jgi:Putative auto-transporter adhesin, head GIN domain
MKKLTLVLILVVIAGAACKHGMHSGVKGSGKRVVQKRDVQPFKSIATEGAFNIEVVCQKDLSLEIEADDNILELVETDVSNDVLHLKNVKGYSMAEPVEIRISVPNLEGLSVSGAGKIDITGMKNEKFEIDSDGAPSIKVSGSTNVVDIDSSGAAKIDTHNLHAEKGVVDSKGVSNIEVDVRDQLDVTISGPSTVTYQGDPSINKTIHGPGKLERRASEGAWEYRLANFGFRIS